MGPRLHSLQPPLPPPTLKASENRGFFFFLSISFLIRCPVSRYLYITSKTLHVLIMSSGTDSDKGHWITRHRPLDRKNIVRRFWSGIQRICVKFFPSIIFMKFQQWMTWIDDLNIFSTKKNESDNIDISLQLSAACQNCSKYQVFRVLCVMWVFWL